MQVLVFSCYCLNYAFPQAVFIALYINKSANILYNGTCSNCIVCIYIFEHMGEEKNMSAQLTRKQFDILEVLAETGRSLTQGELEKETGHSLSTVNRVIKDLSALRYIENSAITNAGLKALEPYRAKRAVFIAAGFGTRLVPITLNTPNL